LIALLPLKEFAAAKQRLSGLLSAAERTQLFQAMVEDVLLVLTAQGDRTRRDLLARACGGVARALLRNRISR